MNVELIQPKPGVIESLGNIRELFLDSRISINNQPEKTQQVLQAMFDIINYYYYPLGRKGDTDIPAPRDRLVELGLLPDNMGSEILRIKSIKKDGQEGYEIIESYTNRKVVHPMNGNQAHTDEVVERIVTLTKPSEGDPISMKITGRVLEMELSALHMKWVAEKVPSKRLHKAQSAKALNITLAFLIESTRPGTIK